jgi:hypothetical protein
MNSSDSQYLIEPKTSVISLLRVPHGYTNNLGNMYDKYGKFIDFPRELGSKAYYKDLEHASASLNVGNSVVASVVHERRNYSYFHWTYETLPKLIYLSQNRKDLNIKKVYYHCGLFGTRYQRAAMRVLGFNRLQLIDAKKVESLTAKEVIAVKLHEEKRNPSLQLCHLIKSAFVKNDCKSPFRRLYLTRKNVKSGRKITNEDDLLKVLADYDFEIIDPGEFSLMKQVNYFNESQCIVGPHGAAFANIVFCRPRTRILELFNHPNIMLGSQSYINISRTCNIDLVRLPSQEVAGSDGGEYSNRRSFRVDLDLIESQLRGWLA